MRAEHEGEGLETLSKEHSIILELGSTDKEMLAQHQIDHLTGPGVHKKWKFVLY